MRIFPTATLLATYSLATAVAPKSCDADVIQSCLTKFEKKYASCAPDDTHCQCMEVITSGANCYAACPQEAMTQFIKTYSGGKCANFDPYLSLRGADDRKNGDYVNQDSSLQEETVGATRTKKDMTTKGVIDGLKKAKEFSQKEINDKTVKAETGEDVKLPNPKNEMSSASKNDHDRTKKEENIRNAKNGEGEANPVDNISSTKKDADEKPELENTHKEQTNKNNESKNKPTENAEVEWGGEDKSGESGEDFAPPKQEDNAVKRGNESSAMAVKKHKIAETENSSDTNSARVNSAAVGAKTGSDNKNHDGAKEVYIEAAETEINQNNSKISLESPMKIQTSVSEPEPNTSDPKITSSEAKDGKKELNEAQMRAFTVTPNDPTVTISLSPQDYQSRLEKSRYKANLKSIRSERARISQEAAALFANPTGVSQAVKHEYGVATKSGDKKTNQQSSRHSDKAAHADSRSSAEQKKNSGGGKLGLPVGLTLLAVVISAYLC